MFVKVSMSRVSTRLKAPWGLHPEVQVNLSTVALPYEVAFDLNGSFKNGQVSFEEKTTQRLPQIPPPGTLVREVARDCCQILRFLSLSLVEWPERLPKMERV